MTFPLGAIRGYPFHLKDGFGYLASVCFQRGWKLFRLRPKIHFHQHLNILMAKGKQSFSVLSSFDLNHHFFWVIIYSTFFVNKDWFSFLAEVFTAYWDYSCWSDEDFIGKISRLSRTTHAATCSFRCFQKALGLYKKLLKSFNWFLSLHHPASERCLVPSAGVDRGGCPGLEDGPFIIKHHITSSSNPPFHTSLILVIGHDYFSLNRMSFALKWSSFIKKNPNA